MNTLEVVVCILIFLTIVYICWNCEVHRSTVVLIVVLCVAIYAMMPAHEDFEEAAVAAPFPSIAALQAAGLERTSVFANCTTEIGSAPERDYLYANKNDM